MTHLRSRVSALALLAVAALTAGCSSSTRAPSFSAAPALAAPDARTYADLSAREIVGVIARGDASKDARAALRSRGPKGLEAALAGRRSEEAAGADAATLDRLAAAADAAAQQKDAIHTGLYWYTDLEEAKQAAQRENKPILSLRMLGRLDDELSCANSRFFRTTLYPQEAVQRRLHDEWILHWSSERPVPVVTIDYGDGRVVKRTITGNSIHYVLDPQGNVIDALPGLVSANQFVRDLDRDRPYALGQVDPEADRRALVVALHDAGISQATLEWSVRTVKTMPLVPMPRPAQMPTQMIGFPTPAIAAIPSAPSKSRVEMPVVSRILPAVALPLQSDVDKVDWASIVDRSDVTLDARTLEIMRAKAPLDWSTGAPKPIDDAGFDRLVETYKDHVALDTARNKFAYHPVIRGWIRDNPDISLGDLNARVYSELFLTPANDPWLGLVPPVAYSGIQGDGLISKGD